MIYRFRVILDTQEDIFRDIEIEQTATCEDFHNTITQSFGFDGTEMASFYISDDEWRQGEEIALFDMSESEKPLRAMSETLLQDVLSEDQTRMIYVYDFFNLWTFFVELAEITEANDGQSYPNLMFAHGQIPAQAPEADFSGDEDDFDDDPFADDEDDYDIEDYEGLDFDENWN
ncbi:MULTISPECIES: hypothetical protein [unclassified Leeuwenhoekiella]|uniref:IS1096 element passenger TnpR family protein n=1 Tax=unclassified Leeuwenhoekiella TaxID=2615029 RepID=UPI000C3B491B|nr:MULTISPECIES: hypothetical protein [unclassified Leeuwenhoekiella]MAW94881.1 hypothetical protein [Leeuwenhoekiella sp.]MBA79601.1 hypothetical protein [Leeuwenhoekiella sp.]|tara:strand:- start:1394 stop:1915 length:522 start_codon:yes stop_codon:yes gene_type:complete